MWNIHWNSVIGSLGQHGMHMLIIIKVNYETQTAIMCETVSVGKPGDVDNIVQFKSFTYCWVNIYTILPKRSIIFEHKNWLQYWLGTLY